MSSAGRELTFRDYIWNYLNITASLCGITSEHCFPDPATPSSLSDICWLACITLTFQGELLEWQTHMQLRSVCWLPIKYREIKIINLTAISYHSHTLLPPRAPPSLLIMLHHIIIYPRMKKKYSQSIIQTSVIRGIVCTEYHEQNRNNSFAPRLYVPRIIF